VRYDDPILETIARSIHTFFPRCIRCGEPIESFDDADVRILTNRVVHRTRCLAESREQRAEGRGLRESRE
jgi:hypothetical protein